MRQAVPSGEQVEVTEIVPVLWCTDGRWHVRRMGRSYRYESYRWLDSGQVVTAKELRQMAAQYEGAVQAA